MGASDALWSQFIKLGKVVGSEKTPNASVPENELATVLIIINLSGGSRIVGSDEGLWVQINNGLYFAFWLLSRGLVFIIIGICGVLPWVIVIWGAVKVFLWMFATPAAKPEVVVAHPAQVKPVEPPPSASM